MADANHKAEFRARLTPEKMRNIVVVSGRYFGGDHGKYPKRWLADAKRRKSRSDVSLNSFGVVTNLSRASGTLGERSCHKRQRQALLHSAYGPFF